MRSLIVYDSAYGNTAQIARAIGEGVRGYGQTVVLLVGEVGNTDVVGIDTLIIGSPTQAGRATQDIQDFIAQLPSLNGIKIAAFDTRFDEKEQNTILRLFMKTIGYATEKISEALESKGGELALMPAGFIVTGKEGPLKVGELERASSWSSGLVRQS